MAKRPTQETRVDRYLQQTAFLTRKWEDGNQRVKGFVVSKHGVIGVTWYYDAPKNRRLGQHAYNCYFTVVHKGRRHEMVYRSDTLTDRGVVTVARRFARRVAK